MKKQKFFKTLSFFLFLLPFTIMAQEKNVSGKITDEKGIPIPYVSIGFKHSAKGLVSADDGTCKFTYSEKDLSDSLLISAIGYEREKIAFTEFLLTPVIILLTKKYELFPIAVSAQEAENIVKKAVEKIPDNYPQSSYFIELFYRQFHRENGKAARLIEAVLNVYDPGYINPQSLLLKEKFEIKELRRSKVFEKNGFNHDDHLTDLFKQNIVHYPRETILNLSALDFFNFEKDSNQISDSTTCIHYFYQNPSDPKIRWGNIDISDNDFAIIRITENTTKNDAYNPRLAARENSEWKFFEGEMAINYKKVSGKYYLDSISFFYRHNIVSKIFGNTDFIVDEYFNFWAGFPDTAVVSSPEMLKKFQNTSNLYSRKYIYNSEFWETYSPLIRHPLDYSVFSEFAKHTPLEQQFMKSETR